MHVQKLMETVDEARFQTVMDEAGISKDEQKELRGLLVSLLSASRLESDTMLTVIQAVESNEAPFVVYGPAPNRPNQWRELNEAKQEEVSGYRVDGAVFEHFSKEEIAFHLLMAMNRPLRKEEETGRMKTDWLKAQLNQTENGREFLQTKETKERPIAMTDTPDSLSDSLTPTYRLTELAEQAKKLLTKNEQTGGMAVKKQKITQFIALKNGWNVGMPNGYTAFSSDKECLVLDGDYDVVAAFVFEKNGVVVKKTGWGVEPKVYYDEKRIDAQMPLEEDDE